MRDVCLYLPTPCRRAEAAESHRRFLLIVRTFHSLSLIARRQHAPTCFLEQCDEICKDRAGRVGSFAARVVCGVGWGTGCGFGPEVLAPIGSACSPPASTTAYTVRESHDTDGVTIREYVLPTNVVFAVTWQGPVRPDMTALLGSYFPNAVSRRRRPRARHRSVDRTQRRIPDRVGRPCRQLLR